MTAHFQSHAFESGDGWPEPDLTLLGTNRRPAPAFPLAVLGPFWSTWAERAAAASSGPVDYAACALLAGAGAAIANVRQFLAGASWSEPSHIWVGLCGSPSSGKTPGMKHVLDLLGHVEDNLAAGFDDERKDYEARKLAAKAHRDAWEGQIRDAVKNGAATPPMPAAAAEPEPPVRKRIRVADATTEKLGALAAALPKGLLVLRDELAGWLGGFDRYGGGGSDRAFALEMFNGGSYRIDRMKSPDPISIRHLSVGIVGNIQPDRLSAVTAGADDGLSSRFLWCWPETKPTFRLARDTFDSLTACDAFHRLASLDMTTDRFGNLEPGFLKLERAAEDTIEQFGQEMAERAEDSHGAFGGSLGKARGQALRLSCILTHLWWSGQPGRPEPRVITEEAVVRACALVADYFTPMAERVFGDAAIPAAEQHAMMIARRLRQTGASTFNAREIGRQGTTALRAPEAMDAACAVLAEANLIRSSDNPGKGRRRKDYAVHPAVWRQA